MTKTLKIKITETYLLQCFLVDQDNNSTIITLHDNQQEYVPCVQISQDVIHVCEEGEKSIHFIEEWIENPEEYKMYRVQYQGKEYSLLSEVLFALVISEYKQRIEKEYIVENTILEILTKNKKVLQRIRVSLNALGLRGMELEEEIIEYEYKEQAKFI